MGLLKVEGFLVVSPVLYLPKFDRNKEYQMMVMSERKKESPGNILHKPSFR